MLSSSQAKAYQLFMSDHEFYIITTKKEFQSIQFDCIKINRLTQKITRLSLQEFQKQAKNINFKLREAIDLIMGRIIINQQPYLILGTQIQSAAFLQRDRIYQIKKVKFIPFKHKFLYQSIDQSQNQKYISYISQYIIKDNFYFCYHQNLTLTRTKCIDKQLVQSKYFWNQNLLSTFSKYKLPSYWTIPVVQGYVSEIHCQNEYFSFYYAMISRRSKEMSGTRFNHRGLNQKFDASNFVQTQQIFICHNYQFSHVSLRGSVPLFWKQESFGADINLKHKQEEQHQKAISHHYKNLQEQYKGKVCTINLLSKGKSPQKQLKSRFQYYYFRAIKDELYLYFDLNQEMKDQNGQKTIDLFMQNSKKVFTAQQNFFCMDRYTKKVYSVQKTFPRINCLDCIDRTNVIMSRISQDFLSQIQTYINTRVNVKQKQLKIEKQVKKNMINLWVQLGNRISMLYCGTQSVATHMTKGQNNSFFSFLSGGIKSINRYYNANVNDNYKHECVQYFLGNKQQNSQTCFFQDNISKKILNQTKYCQYEQIGMYVMTWNCNMVDPQKLTLKQKHKLFTFLNQKIDLVVLGLQQMVELNSYNVLLGNNQSIISEWSKVILDCLNNQDINRNSSKKFKLYTIHDLVGIATFVFVNQNIEKKIRSFEWFDIKTGFKGNSGHKGAIVMFLQLNSSWITFINCHLASGQNKTSERLQDIQFIHNEAIRQRRKRRLFDVSEFKFFFGDMNFNMDLKSQIVRQQLYKIQKQDKQKKLTKNQLEEMLAPLLQTDQFLKNKIGYLRSYSEPSIYFLPTYKYEIKTKKYDLKRTPSWYDRILYQSAQIKKIGIIRYGDIDVYLSDHKPVFGMYNILVKTQNRERKNKYIIAYLME